MNLCPACRGTGAKTTAKLVLVAGAKKPPEPCPACAGTGKLAEVLLR